MLDAIDRGAAGQDVTVFRYRRANSLLIATLLAAIGIALVVFGILVRRNINFDGGWVAYVAIGVFAWFVFLAFNAAVSKLRDLVHADTNVLVVTPAGVVLRCRRRIKSWRFVEFPEVSVILNRRRQIEAIHLCREGRTFDEELVDDGSFGAMGSILEALRAYRPVVSSIA